MLMNAVCVLDLSTRGMPHMAAQNGPQRQTRQAGGVERSRPQSPIRRGIVKRWKPHHEHTNTAVLACINSRCCKCYCCTAFVLLNMVGDWVSPGVLANPRWPCFLVRWCCSLPCRQTMRLSFPSSDVLARCCAFYLTWYICAYRTYSCTPVHGLVGAWGVNGLSLIHI